MIPPEDHDLADRMSQRAPLSLAHQVIYQCRVLAMLRENPARAPELLRDPVLLHREYEARWVYGYTADEPDDY